jgi:SAM-dependent methyltransferase
VTWEEAVRTLIADPARAELARQCYFDAPLIEAARRFHDSNEWHSVRARLRGRRGLALDVGAGNGIVSYALAVDGWEVTAVEPDPSALVGSAAVRSLAVQSGLPIAVVEGTTDDLAVPPGHFDAILVRQVFHHVRDLDAFIARLARMLAPGGRLLTWRDHVITRKADLPRFFDSHPLHHQYGGENAFMETEYRQAIDRAGLIIDETLRHFDDPMNYGPQSPAELLASVAARILPRPVARATGALLGAPASFRALGPILSAVDRRPGRHVAFVAHKPG